ncbi:MAG: DEAD/DEAH box helicase [Trueperaceae bacterium]|nr:DEAD/DEAH box helicase [Trueperaceae bacterium]
METFDLRDNLIGDYADYVGSFVQIRDERIAPQVDELLASGRLWPQTHLQLNPSFQRGGGLDALASDGILHPRMPDAFRVGKTAEEPLGTLLSAHQHQIDALPVARGGHPYVVTTGTGSGKSLTYMIPIVEHGLRNGSGKGIQAIAVHPMNALANGQLGELQHCLRHGFVAPHIA